MRGGRVGHALMVSLIRAGMLWICPPILFFVSLYFVFASPKGTRASFDLARHLGRGKNLLARFLFAWRHNFTYATLLVERVAILAGQKDRFTFERPSRQVIEPFVRGGGLLFVTAHIGIWEIMGHLLADERSAPVNLVMHDRLQPELRAMLTAGRAFKVIETDGSPASAAEILEALQRGEIVGMMGDRLFLDEGIEVDFLGGKARLPLGPYAVAAAARVPIVHAFALRTGRRRYAFLATEIGVPSRRQREASVQAFADRLGELLARDPFQWGNFFPFWS